jgi:hypothetical protein
MPAVPPKLPSIWNGGWLSNRFGSVDFASSLVRFSSAVSPSPSRAKWLTIQARLQPVALRSA